MTIKRDALGPHLCPHVSICSASDTRVLVCVHLYGEYTRDFRRGKAAISGIGRLVTHSDFPTPNDFCLTHPTRRISMPELDVASSLSGV